MMRSLPIICTTGSVRPKALTRRSMVLAATFMSSSVASGSVGALYEGVFVLPRLRLEFAVAGFDGRVRLLDAGDVGAAAKELGGGVCVVKAQVHAGGRGLGSPSWEAWQAMQATSEPKAAPASDLVTSMELINTSSLCTTRMPRPPPPAAALTITG